MFSMPRRIPLPVHLRREAVTLTVLTGLAIVCFVAVTGLSGMYRIQEAALAERWGTRGFAELNAANYKDAVTDFRTALRYSHDDFNQQLGLAEALLGMKRTEEADAYLVNLWEQEPENGIVNRELARIAAGKKDVPQALRSYHNAVYGTWTGDAEKERRATRWELVKYLLSLGATTQAQSELISLSAEVGDDPAQQALLGQYFLKVNDDQHALAAFRLCLAADPHSVTALAGAGRAEFDMQAYQLAREYLRKAVTDTPGDAASAALLETIEQVVRMDPFRRQISDAERFHAVQASFDAAGSRLKACPAAAASIEPGSPQSLGDSWNKIKPQITQQKLRNDPDMVNQVMELVMNIERQADGKCGAGTPTDAALLLISKMHEGS